MRAAALIACLLAGSIRVFPESNGSSSASRITDLKPRAESIALAGIVSDEVVRNWVSTWQKRLDLADWKIESKIVRLEQLPKGTLANIHWSLPRKQATIRVLDSLDSTLRKEEIAYDTELSVVHELVHLSMAKLPLDSVNTDLEEEAVKKLSTALLSLQHAPLRQLGN